MTDKLTLQLDKDAIRMAKEYARLRKISVSKLVENYFRILNAPELDEEYRALGTAAGYYDDWHEGRDPAGISTQDPELEQRLDPVVAGHRLANYLRVMTLECQTLARACGKSHVHNLEPEDLVALTVEASAMAKVPLAGTSWIRGAGGY